MIFNDRIGALWVRTLAGGGDTLVRDRSLLWGARDG